MFYRQAAFEGNKKMLKGALHCHTSRSDGDFTPEDLLRTYHEHGYDVVAITDHRIYNYKNYVDDFPITIIPGFEFDNVFDEKNGRRQFHTVALGYEKEVGNGFEQDQTMPTGTANNQEEYQKYLDEIHANGNITFYCHPEYSSTPSRYFDKMQGDFAMEVYNSGSHVYADMDKDAAYWDELLGQGKKIFGVATDDTHTKYEICHAWVMVNAENNVTSILEALKNGAFYSSTGPEIYDFYIEDNKVIVKCSNAKLVRLHCDKHANDRAISHDADLTQAKFGIDDNYTYVRASVIDKEGRIAWTNPIFLD